MSVMRVVEGIGQFRPQFPCSVRSFECGFDGGEGFGGRGVSPDGGAGGHGAKREEDQVVGFDVDDTCFAQRGGRCEVDFLSCDCRDRLEGEVGNFGVWDSLSVLFLGRMRITYYIGTQLLGF